jgi:hypothetical protein
MKMGSARRIFGAKSTGEQFSFANVMSIYRVGAPVAQRDQFSLHHRRHNAHPKSSACSFVSWRLRVMELAVR